MMAAASFMNNSGLAVLVEEEYKERGADGSRYDADRKFRAGKDRSR